MAHELSQVDTTMNALLRGETLDQLTMLFDYGIGNHTAVITEVRRKLAEVSPLEEVVTEWRHARSRKTGRHIRYATYYIPTRRKMSFVEKARRRLGWTR